MIAIQRAIEIVLFAATSTDHPEHMPAEPVSLTNARHRILREDILSDVDSPPFDKSIRDGFAVRHEDIEEIPAVLRVLGESRAGKAADVEVIKGGAVEIMTGAPMPEGADTVVMVEHTEPGPPGHVRVLKKVQRGNGLLLRGVEAAAGECLLTRGRRIELADIGLLASTGKAQVLVSKKPQVAILATGDELTDVEAPAQSGRIRNSNSYTLHAQVIAAGAEPVLLGIARDDLEDLRQKIGHALEHDIALISGGVSMGKYDLVEDVFREFGVEVMFDQVAMRPGKPTVFGRRGMRFVFGLPGNPISTMVSFHMFVRPLIAHLLKASNVQPGILTALLEAETRCDPERTALVPALVRSVGGSYRIQTAPWKGSSDLAGLARANALIIIPNQQAPLSAGSLVEFLFLE